MSNVSKYISGISKLEDTFYNAILPSLLISNPTEANKRLCVEFKIDTVGDYPNVRGSKYYSIYKSFLDTGVIDRSLQNHYLIVVTSMKMYKEFMSKIVMGNAQGKFATDAGDFSDNTATCLTLKNAYTREKMIVIIMQDFNELIDYYRKRNVTAIDPDISIELMIKSLLLHEIVHAEDYINTQRISAIHSYMNNKEIHAYSAQFEWIDKEVGKPLMLRKFGAKSYNGAAKKFINSIINP